MAALDSWRGLCACAVVLFHLRTTGFLTNLPLIRGAWLFVDFFFVLSGFVITASYRERLAGGFPLRVFMLLRLGRVYPLYAVVLLAFVAMECGALLPGLGHITSRQPFTQGRSIPELAGNLFLLQSFGFYPSLTWNGPSWSIAAEVWTYLAAALAMRLARPRFAVAVLLAVLGSAAVLVHGGGYLDRTYDLGAVRCLFGFALGSGAWLLFEARPALDWSARTLTLLEVGIVAVVVALVSNAGQGPLTMACPPVFVLAIWVFAIGGGAISRLLHRPAVVTIGRLSYSIYIIHILIVARTIDLIDVIGRHAGVRLASTGGQGGMKTLVGPAWASDLMAIAILALTIAVARLSYRYVEAPCRDWSKRLAARFHARRAEALAPSM